MTLRAVMAVLALGQLLACGGAAAPPADADLQNGTYVEPQPLPSGLTGCDTQSGMAVVSAYLAALNALDVGRLATLVPGPDTWSFTRSADGRAFVSSGGGIELRPAHDRRAAAEHALAAGMAALQRLYPDAGAWELTFSPSVDAAIASGLASAMEVNAASLDQLPGLLDQVSGLHFTVRRPLGGAAGWVDHTSPTGTVRVREVDLGPTFWRATGPRLQRQGRTLVTGGGKVAVYCEGLVLKRVLLSPLAFR
jgi:hypothetical protein